MQGWGRAAQEEEGSGLHRTRAPIFFLARDFLLRRLSMPFGERLRRRKQSRTSTQHQAAYQQGSPERAATERKDEVQYHQRFLSRNLWRLLSQKVSPETTTRFFPSSSYSVFFVVHRSLSL